MNYGYARVITAVFVDKASGKDFNRPQYKRMMRQLRPGDCVHVVSLDRLGRDYAEIQEQWRLITHDKKAHICVLDMPLLDTRKGGDLLGRFIADLVLQILAYVAQTEREAIKKRQAEGIKCALARGVRFGRPRGWVPPDGYREAVEAYRRGELSGAQAATRCGLVLSTFYTHARAGD